jgi:hypothetical protein
VLVSLAYEKPDDADLGSTFAMFFKELMGMPEIGGRIEVASLKAGPRAGTVGRGVVTNDRRAPGPHGSGFVIQLATEAEPSKHLASGAPVAVRSSFEGRWCSGYEIADIIRDGGGVAGYRLRRTSERTVLPAVFPVRDVIPASR